MPKSAHMGMNRTGMEMSPIHSKLMLEGNQIMPPDQSDIAAFTATEKQYIHEAEPVGSIPMPGTIKGAFKTAMKKLSGSNPEIFINKLGERLAFERSGVRLYDHLIIKCLALTNGQSTPLISLEQLRHFREEETKHFQLVQQALQQLGADPSAVTPDADINAVAAQGLQKVLADPRSTIAQCLEVMLVAELSDNAGWELLIKLCDEMDLTDLSQQFTTALNEEQQHLIQVKEWLTKSVLTEAGLV